MARHLKPTKQLLGREAVAVLVPPNIKRPLLAALDAVDAGDMVTALSKFGECAAIDPTNKAVLYFGSDAAQKAYFHLRFADPPPAASLVSRWRAAAFTLSLAACEADPQDPVPAHNLARFIHDDGDDKGCVEWYRQALSLKRDFVESWGNLGTALYSEGHVEEAEACWTKCVTFETDQPSGLTSQAYVWLRRGDYARGWAALNARWSDPTFLAGYARKDLPGQMWTGQPLRKRDQLYVHGEQGLGDHVQFARYLPILIEQGYPVCGLETRAPLKTWMEACLPEVPIYVRDVDEKPHITHHVSLMSLPGILGLSDFPPPLKPDVPRATKDISPRPLRVGLLWRGTTGNMADFQRSIPVEKLEALSGMSGVTWVPLQYDPSGAAGLQASLWIGDNVEQAPPYDDVLGLAKVMMGLDMVVAVDTLGAHVSGSLGVPTLMLHRFCREWRWGQHTARTDWYPSVTNITCPKPYDWDGVLAEVRETLGRQSMLAETVAPK